MPDALKLPLSVEPTGLLGRGSEADAVVQMIGVMASTSSAFWAHAPWFGLLELFANAKTDVQELPGITDAINVALRSLGCDGVSVRSVRNASGRYGERSFDISISEADGTVVFRQIQT